MTGSPGMTLMLLVDNWDSPEDTAGGMWEPLSEWYTHTHTAISIHSPMHLHTHLHPCTYHIAGKFDKH